MASNTNPVVTIPISDNDPLVKEVEHLRAINKELLQVLREAVAYVDWPRWNERASAAIAKATAPK